MKKLVMTLAAVLCCTLTISAQDVPADRNKQYNIVLNNSQYTHRDEKMSTGDAVSKILTGVLTGKTSVQAPKFEEDVKTAIVKGLSNARRFRYNEGLLQSSDNAEGGHIVVDAVITNITAKSESKDTKDKDGKTKVTTTYTGLIDVTLTLKDAKTGDVVSSPSFNAQSSSYPSNSTSDQAIRSAMSTLSRQITNWLNKYRPLKANILEGARAKKTKQKEVYIDLGSREGAFEGLHFGVYVVKTIAGREAKSQIGKLKVEEVEGADISLCKVQSGGKDIKEALDSGQQLQVISID